jgi:hypothetical protein
MVPLPTADSSSTLPPAPSTCVRTTSIPTPRPEISVTLAAVLKPGRNTRSSASRALMAEASAAVSTPFLMACRLSLSGSMPPPSSSMEMETIPPSCEARTVSVPPRGLPAAIRTSGASMP